MSPDWSTKPEAVPYSSLDNPQSLNLYGYVNNNPLSSVDSDGHDGAKCFHCAAFNGGPPTNKGGSPREQQAIKGVLELGAVALAAPEIGAAAIAVETVSGGLVVGGTAVTAAGTFVNGTTDLAGAATNTNTEDATSRVTSVTNPIAITVGLITGSAKKGSQAADLASAAGAIKHPADAAASIGGAIDAVKDVVNKVTSFISTPAPPSPKAPGAPSCSVAGACQ